jgi:hypothetical protein
MAAGKIFTMIKNLVKKKKGVDAYLKSKASKQIANKKFKVKAERVDSLRKFILKK